MLKESGDIQNLKLTGSSTNSLEIIVLELLKRQNSPTMKAKYSSVMEIRRKLFSVIKSLQQDKPKSNLPDGYLGSDLPQIFNDFFVNKISDIQQKRDVTVNLNENYDEVESATSQLRELIPVTESEIIKSLCLQGNVLHHLILYFYPEQLCLPWICSITLYNKIVNLSIQLGQFPSFLKHALVKPLLKKNKS